MQAYASEPYAGWAGFGLTVKGSCSCAIADMEGLFLDAIARVQEKISSNFKESNSDELDDSFAPPTKKPRLVWKQELHQQFVEANEKTLSNNIESKRREGAYGRFDLTAFGDTNHLLYVALHLEE
ncbi:hypothetical protein JHK84_052458 [Glycine max]|nr:hypothetical protein JHK84_052458 [Glycine max]